MKIRYCELFAGIGGFRVGLEKTSDKFQCVYSNEWDKYANSVYKKHYGECDNRDIREVKAEEIQDCDLIVGGVSCQPWSVAGKRGGFKDERGNMWLECFRILRAKQPKFFIFENVKGLLSHNGSKSMERICEELCSSGYSIDFEVLNSKDYGVPQNRQRVFIIGVRLDLLDKYQIFNNHENNRQTKEKTTREPKNKNDGIQLSSRYQQYTFAKRYIRGRSRSKVLPKSRQGKNSLKYIGGVISKRDNQANSNKKRTFSQGQRVYSADGISTTLAANAGGMGGKTGLYAISKGRSDSPWKKTNIIPTLKKSFQDNVGVVLTPNRLNKRQDGRRFKKKGEPSFTVNTQDKHGVAINSKIINPLKGKTKFGHHFKQNVYDKKGITRAIKSSGGSGNRLKIINNTQIRRLTPTECLRLQNFPDDWCDVGVNNEKISDTQKYKMAGNAVTTSVVEAIALKLIDL